MNSAICAHAFDSFRGGKHQAQIEYDGEYNAHEDHKDSEPAHRFLRKINFTTHGGFVRFESEMRKDYGAGYAGSQAPNP